MTIDTNKVDQLKKWFVDYVNTFKSDDYDLQKNYDIKSYHTFKVCEEMLYLTQSLGLNKFETAMAQIIALFHDLGRFEQYKNYRTFSDKKSEDHSKLAVKIILEKELLDFLDTNSSTLICKAILNHNKTEIDSENDKQLELYSKLIRDADKIDIYRVITDYYLGNDKENMTVQLELPDTEGFSSQIIECVLNQQVISYSLMKNLNDFKIIQLGWVFDLNFAASIKRIENRQYLPKIYSTMPVNSNLVLVYEKINDFVKKFCNIPELV